MTRVGASMAVGVPAAVISVVLLGTTTGVYVLDIVDHSINRFGILSVAVVSMLALTWVFRKAGLLRDHLNLDGSVHVGRWWQALIGVVATLALLFILYRELVNDIDEPYEGYPAWMLNTLGWGAAVAVIVVGYLASRMRWRPETSLDDPELNEPVTKKDPV